MKKRILTYRKYIDSLLASDKQSDWKYIKQEHITQVAFFQHERLVHLIVTVTFAVLELLTVCAYVIVGWRGNGKNGRIGKKSNYCYIADRSALF